MNKKKKKSEWLTTTRTEKLTSQELHPNRNSTNHIPHITNRRDTVCNFQHDNLIHQLQGVTILGPVPQLFFI